MKVSKGRQNKAKNNIEFMVFIHLCPPYFHPIAETINTSIDFGLLFDEILGKQFARFCLVHPSYCFFSRAYYIRKRVRKGFPNEMLSRKAFFMI
jgi:hypothetical protein